MTDTTVRLQDVASDTAKHKAADVEFRIDSNGNIEITILPWDEQQKKKLQNVRIKPDDLINVLLFLEKMNFGMRECLLDPIRNSPRPIERMEDGE